MTPGESRLREALRRRRRPEPKPLKAEPSNAFEIAVAEQLRYLQQDIDELRSRFNWLLTVIVGAALLNVVIEILK